MLRHRTQFPVVFGLLEKLHSKRTLSKIIFNIQTQMTSHNEHLIILKVIFYITPIEKTCHSQGGVIIEDKTEVLKYFYS